MVVGLGGFYRAADYYRNRRNYMKQLIEKASNDTNSRKIIIERNNIDMDRLGVTWSFANETLLISSLEGPENSKTIYLVDNLEELKNYDMKKTDVFLCVPFWLEWNYSSLNPRYFRLPREPYCILEDKGR